MTLENIQPVNITIKADFSKTAGFPLVKSKFSLFHSGYVPLKRAERDINLLGELGANSLRHEFGWGVGAPYGNVKEPVTGTLDDIVYDFEEVNQLAAMLLRANILPYWSYTYTPLPLQKDNDPKSTPVDMEKWREVLRDMARNFREKGLPITAHEVYNEPDLWDEKTGQGVFFNGTRDEYFEMYRYGVKGFKEGDPDAQVGGPSIAMTGENSWTLAFLEYVKKHDLPLDFFSFHHYGWETLPVALQKVRDELSSDPRFVTTAMHLNEYNPYIYRPADTTGPVDHYEAAPQLLADFAHLLNHPWLTEIHWAQGLDPADGCEHIGVISTDGHRKAAFNAWKIYSRMPVDRSPVVLEGATNNCDIGCLASYDSRLVSLVVWNRSLTDQSLEISLGNIAFERGTYRIYVIDKNHASYYDAQESETLVPIETHSDAKTAGLAWQGNLAANTVLYLEVENENGPSESQPVSLGKIVRLHHYYPDRKGTAYADFDRTTWIARLGMGESQSQQSAGSVSVTGVEAENIPADLRFDVTVVGELQKVDNTSFLGVRLDYYTGDTWTKGVLFHGSYNGGIDLYDASNTPELPWGTLRPADEVVAVEDLRSFKFSPAVYAPEDWNERIIITYLLINGGPQTSARITVRQA